MPGSATHHIAVRGPFDLAASTRFLAAFTPAGRDDLAGATPGGLPLAFPAPPGRSAPSDWRVVRALVEQRDGAIVVTTGETSAVEHVARILSLDLDGTGFAAVGDRDPVAAALQRDHPGLRPVLFNTPYEAACWTIIGQRLRITQAAAIRRRIAQRLGERVEIGGVVLDAFPAPDRLLAAETIPGLPEIKRDRLRAIARAALDGALDATALRATEPEAALERLRLLPGIGEFSAELILVRGAGHPDVFPTAERRLHAEMANAYHLTEPSAADLAAITDRWHPFRSWVALLLRTAREDRTHEIAGPAR